jgi:hypothetical protein
MFYTLHALPGSLLKIKFYHALCNSTTLKEAILNILDSKTMKQQWVFGGLVPCPSQIVQYK